MNSIFKGLQENRWVFLLSLLFVLTAGIAFLNDFSYYLILPAVMIFAYFGIFRYDVLILMTVFFAPLSVQLIELVDSPVDLYLPTEPILIALLLVFILQRLSGKYFPKEILLHPVSLTIYVYIGWMLITSLTSTMPLVSIKYTLSRIWFVVVYFLFFILLFQNKQKLKVFTYLYLIALILVTFYTIGRHIQLGLLSKDAAHMAVRPFYNDHTSYGAALAYILFLLVPSILGIKDRWGLKFFLFLVTGYIILALILSYSRAAWLSVVFSIGVLFAILLKIRFRFIFLVLVILTTVVIIIWPTYQSRLERHDKESSYKLDEHVESITNISTDASNVERINRWSAALRMFKEKPLQGFGPGTYMFKYAPYQNKEYRTIISVNTGTRGNAHSEYLGPLSEQGVFGVIFYIIVLATVLKRGIRNYYVIPDRSLKLLNLGAVLGIFTYVFHGIINNFLDTDKISVLFWGSMAIIVAIDLYHLKPADNEEIKETSR